MTNAEAMRMHIDRARAAGHSHLQAIAIAHAAMVPVRADAGEMSPHANMIMHSMLIAKSMGTKRARKTMPKQQYPMLIESDYAARIVALVRRAHAKYDKLLTEIPALLRQAQADRGDSAELAASPSVTDTLAMFSGRNEHVTFAGFPIVIENPVGSFRSWIDSSGKPGYTMMLNAYGYIEGAIGVDGDEVDVYLGPQESAPWVYAVRQLKKSSFDQSLPNRRSGERADVAGGMFSHGLDVSSDSSFDEWKVMVGFPSADAAKRAYMAHYNDPRFFGGMVTLSVADFSAEIAKSTIGKITNRSDTQTAAERAKQLIDQAEAAMQRDLSAKDIENLATFFARQTSQQQRAQLAKQLSNALGIEVLPDEKYIPALLDYFTHENASLITSIPEQLHREVANLTARAFTKRMTPETFAAHLQQRFDVSESRARFIARDQIGKLWGQLNAVRQRGVGVTGFYWETRKDDRVRPSHKSIQGVRFDYDNPPKFGLPGEDFGCRCIARPDVSGILEQASSMYRGHALPSITRGT